MQFKYIVFKGVYGDEIVLFPDYLEHNLVANRWCYGPGVFRPAEMVISAGFVRDGRCYGKSVSLNKESRPNEDTRLLQKYFYDETDY